MTQPGRHSADDSDPGPDRRAEAFDPSADPEHIVPALEGLTEVTMVAHGGDSTIYRAHQSHPSRDVALKVLDLTTPEDLQRFEREIRITVQLGRQHPNIMKVLETRRFPDGRNLAFDDPQLRPTLLTPTHDGVTVTVTFSADGSTIARVGLVDLTHYDIETDTGKALALASPVDPATGTITATLPTPDDPDAP